MNSQLQRIVLVIVLVGVGAAPRADQITGFRQPPFEGVAVVGSIVGTSELGATPPGGAGIDHYIEWTMNARHIPGVAALILKDGEVFWTGSYGYANVEREIDVTDTTLFMLASISKTLTGTALMQLWEAGLYDLDDNINDYLPFNIINPYHPGYPITFRQLLTHTSSLRDNWSVMLSLYSEGDSPIPLGYFVEQYFTPPGEYYNAGQNFYGWAPGTDFSYCNMGFALSGFLVEVLTGTDFSAYCRDSVFSPLQMDLTAWFFAETDSDNVAMPYWFNGEEYVPYGHFGYPDYPAGQLRSSCSELARHLLAFMQMGQLEGVRVLDSLTVAMMTTPQCPELYGNIGIVWFRMQDGERVLWGHGGGDQGVSTLMTYCPEMNVGVIVLLNSSSGASAGMISHQLYECAGDSDGDSILGAYDNCPETYNPDQADEDNDGVGDACDVCPGFSDVLDADYDGVPDSCDNCPLVMNQYQEDHDGDGVGSHCDNCVADYNPDQADTDYDGNGDSCDLCPGYDDEADFDHDNWPDSCDNCPTVSNWNQADTDGDGIGDACCCSGIRGNVNGDIADDVDIVDLTMLVDYLFAGGPLAGCPAEANIDGDPGEVINIVDVTLLVAYLFASGDPPAACP